MKKILLVSLLAVAFVGCTGFKQDPLSDKDEAIKNAVDENTKLDEPEALDSKAFSLVNTEESFKEGEKKSIIFKETTFIPGYTYSFIIQNMDEFKDATYNSKTNEFTWTPAAGTVESGKSSKRLTMNVFVLATPENDDGTKSKLKRLQNISIFVENEITKPVVKSIRSQVGGALNTVLEEGRTFTYTATVEDAESANTSGMQPRLTFSGKLAPYATMAGIRFLSANLWEIDFRVDLGTAELTKSMENISMVVTAVNRMNAESIPYSTSTVNFTVQTRFGVARVNFPSSYEFKPNVPGTVSFLVWDSNYEANVNVTVGSPTDLPTGATLACDVPVGPVRQCVLNWTPNALDAGRYFNAYLKVDMKTTNPSDTRVSTTSSLVSLRVAFF